MAYCVLGIFAVLKLPAAWCYLPANTWEVVRRLPP